MASSPTTRRGGGGGAESLLPFSSPKSKTPKKIRRKTAIINFIYSNFFTIILSISSSFFFLLILLRSGNPKTRSPGRIRPPRPGLGDGKVFGALVDVTTKGLYDKIEFLDADGGPWKQGWNVSYEGDEWDNEMLKVFVVPHSHNDPGWKLTVDEYYEKQTRHILDSIVESLSKDARRKFIWEEMSYLERWWKDAADLKRESFIKLVKNGQLEIVGGGWVMNDEANSHFFGIIEQVYSELFSLVDQRISDNIWYF